MPTLHIFRGLPGSGKTTAARKLAEETGAILIEPDALLVQDGEYRYTPERWNYAFDFSTLIAAGVMGIGGDVIYADVLPRRSVVYLLARRITHNYHPVIVHDLKITAEESKARNRHNVRPEDIDRMTQEWEDWE